MQVIYEWLIWAVDKVWPLPIIFYILYAFAHVVRVLIFRALGVRSVYGYGLSMIFHPLWWIIPTVLNFIIVLIAMLSLEEFVSSYVGKHGVQTEAFIVNRESSSILVNYEDTLRITLSYKTHDKEDVTVSYLTSSNPYYPPTDFSSEPNKGEVVNIKYLRHRPTTFVILKDENSSISD
ncbi:hypothetical protein [Taylorella equigenitalis]|uniref:DUF3592 domain-containing protein n=1 Tax=Taylorella equigenitalis ATCC 35865 TaxID=743973 RepID=A0ABN4AXE5_9BURK|nr:hypothetical protein [Taylorella equigenitalis]AFN35245.1 hypothetical protein KUI_0144 [Taylorella equigenitalis ATCC 35865]ASY38682.1 hypothetical protein CA604_00720 [Taylorella equigenitalis]VEG30277.1 Uncharacterised protein [Taylorella equigenitalis ATCC 35865]